jgi:hyaluronan synthase
VLEDSMHEFMTAKFLGVFLEVSDDRTLTNLTLKRGYRTVYQATSLVYTDAPTKLKKLVKQQFRWARGSQYNTLRMLPWMLGHAPMLAFFFLCDIVLPFLLLCSAIAWIIRSTTHHGDTNLYLGLLHVRSHAFLAIIVLTVLTSTLAMCLRQARHIGEVPTDMLWMPLYILFSTVVLMPIRLFGFLRCGHVGSWGTRAHAYSADDHPGGTEALGTPASSRGTVTAPVAAPPRVEAADGDPRALIPYLIVAAVITFGVLYDVLPV